MNMVEAVVFLAAGIGLLCAFSISASASDSKHILEELRKHDIALSQGTIIYEKSTTASNKYKSKGTIYYSADGRYHKITEPISGNILACEEIFDGTDDIVVINGSIHEVQLGSDMHIDTPSARRIDMAQGPCFAMGRGLSTLENIVITTDSQGVHLSGTSPEGAVFEARLDPDHQYVATEIVNKISNPGIIKSVKWELSHPKSFNGSPFVATDSTYDIVHIKYSVNHHFVISKADFIKPDEALLNYDWHKPGMQISDSRMGSRKTIIYRPGDLPPGITSSQLLALTRQKLAKEAKKDTYGSLFLCAIIAGMTATIGTITFFALKRKR